MNLRLPSRALVPVVVLAVLAGVVATFIVARPPSAADDTPTLVRPKRSTAAPVKPKVRKPATAAAAKPKPRPKAKPKVAPAKPKPLVPVAKRAPAANVPDANGIPRVLETALAGSRVVVVGLYDPNSALDRIALEEARAGAKAAGVGFVALNVFVESQSRPLLERLGALENPSVLVYKRPNALFARLGGFVDSQTVAQAAANAAR